MKISEDLKTAYEKYLEENEVTQLEYDSKNELKEIRYIHKTQHRKSKKE